MSTDSPLSKAASPFLLHGATQPVRWEPWGEAAFERARAEGKPVLLDIGAVWCHWCHVMDHESYEDPDTAAIINELFVPVKVDRDERPDVDARYQRAVQAMTGQGGWPLTAFLTPEGEPFFGGTYFPPQDRYGRPSFSRVLHEVSRIWREERGRAEAAAVQLRQRLGEIERTESEPGRVDPRHVETTLEALAGEFDFRNGGFGREPKFPNAGALDLALDRWLDGGEDWIRRMVTDTLEGMGRGGINDQLGGGFHRYATDARWLVPHFEKMAYDNGVLLASYARAHAVFGDPFYRGVAEAIIEHYLDIALELVESGGFPASQDADVAPGDDGAYWTWSHEEIVEALDGDDRLVRAAVLRYGLEDPGGALHSDPSRHVLFLAQTPEAVAERLGEPVGEIRELLGEIARRLKAVRDRRPRPYVDTSVYTGWTAMVASGHIAAARHLGRADAGAAALRALDRVWAESFREGRGVAHRLGDAEGDEHLADQAHVALALLDAFELSQRPEYLDRARALLAIMERRFVGDEPGYLDRPSGAPSPVAALARPYRPIADAPEPAANSVAALALSRVAALTGAGAERERASALLGAFAGAAARMPTATATFARAADWATSPVTTVVVVGDEGGAGADELFATALRVYRPRTVVRRFAPGRAPAGELPPALAAMLGGEAPRAYVCAGQTCAAPVAEPEALAELLRSFRG